MTHHVPPSTPDDAGDIGLLGYGRFGAALAGLLSAHGRRWRAFDPHAEVPAAHAAANIEALARASDLLVIAVPVPAFERTLRTLRPLLETRHTVIDVGSVKQRPCALMDEVLGETIAHAGTHPLFGPLSIARAEPRRVVICASAHHPASAERIASLFVGLGCEVAMQSPETHDRHMALTHAMAFFIAKGLLDLGIGDDLRWTPPSFAALAASIAAVRADAGHLFAAIHHENPHAADTRRQFIEALGLIDARIGEDGDHALPAQTDAALAIPDLGQHSPALREVREHIDELDRELVDLLRRRRELSTRAAEAKRRLGAPVLDPTRETELLRRRGDWAAAAGLEPDAVQALFKGILGMSRRAQG
ncbi:prephenate dehydrogenase/arogenate dehydrogenase family protein [Lysobacter pythonis]|uniref:chorismate mutase n=1 Tax=Solilutibacter pythonis TaxID=2483112 RepID=A0A3M2I5L1_9GAMM|nr:prephenate dehydrogenase/arogenate dehydrogenase family protein [Lysobacter pythonis]RMH93747.1 prephenate dehydrogenase/arogenate dehydrogenase family protein [Lysobacter pythonis]